MAAGRRQSLDVRQGSRDLVCCIRVTVLIPIIDFRAARLEDSMMVDRFHTLDGPDLGPRRTVLFSVRDSVAWAEERCRA